MPYPSIIFSFLSCSCPVIALYLSLYCKSTHKPRTARPVLSCPVLSCLVLPCPTLPCPTLSCPTLPCTALHCTALHCTVVRTIPSNSHTWLQRSVTCIDPRVTLDSLPRCLSQQQAIRFTRVRVRDNCFRVRFCVCVGVRVRVRVRVSGRWVAGR